MNKITIDNLGFSLFSVEEDNDVTIKVFDNVEECGQGLFSIQCNGDWDEEYYLYKWFDEREDRCFPSCVETVIDYGDGDEDYEYYRLKVVGVDEI